jgi:hypothetical protein
MAFLRDVSDRLWSFVSPRKTQQRREKPFKIPAIPLKKENRSVSETSGMSPETRVRQWNIGTPISNGIDHTQLPPSPPTSLARKYVDYDNETLLEEIAEFNPDGEETWDANEDTFVAQDGDYTPQKKSRIDAELKLARRREHARNLSDAGWADDAIFLFQKLDDRGYEPLLPADWIDDFEMLPEDIFTSSEDEAFVKATDGTDFHGTCILLLVLRRSGLMADQLKKLSAPSLTLGLWLVTRYSPKLPSALPRSTFVRLSKSTTIGL